MCLGAQINFKLTIVIVEIRKQVEAYLVGEYRPDIAVSDDTCFFLETRLNCKLN